MCTMKWTMGDLTRQPETKLLTQAVVQLRLVVDGYFWTPVLAATESILFYINWPLAWRIARDR